MTSVSADILAVDSAPRPSFRSALTQTSQMGNFKHQSLRASDRDRDRDREGESNRDTQSLRNVSICDIFNTYYTLTS